MNSNFFVPYLRMIFSPFLFHVSVFLSDCSWERQIQTGLSLMAAKQTIVKMGSAFHKLHVLRLTDTPVFIWETGWSTHHHATRSWGLQSHTRTLYHASLPCLCTPLARISLKSHSLFTSLPVLSATLVMGSFFFPFAAEARKQNQRTCSRNLFPRVSITKSI